MDNKEIRKQVQSINEAFCQVIEAYGEWAKAHGLSYNELMILCNIDEFQGCTQKMISKREGIAKQTVNSILTEFKAKGYVFFEPDTKDKREKLIHFTAQGLAYVKPLLKELYGIEERAMSGLGAAGAQQFVDLNKSYADLFCEEVLIE